MSGTVGGRQPADAGAATVLAAAAVGVLVCVLGLGLQVGAAVLARHRAETAADLAALAGAREAVRGADVACARASEVAAGNGARLITCSVEGWTVLVVTQRPCACLPSVSGHATGRARAGPAASGGAPVRRPGDVRCVAGTGRAECGPG